MQEFITHDDRDMRTPRIIRVVEQHKIKVTGVDAVGMLEALVIPQIAGAVRGHAAAEQR